VCGGHARVLEKRGAGVGAHFSELIPEEREQATRAPPEEPEKPMCSGSRSKWSSIHIATCGRAPLCGQRRATSPYKARARKDMGTEV